MSASMASTGWATCSSPCRCPTAASSSGSAPSRRSRSVRLVLCDGGDGVAGRAAARAAALGYTNVFVLEGGVPAWGAAGYTIYAGVNVPSKVFGEIVEHARHTPRISARDLEAMRERGRQFRHRRRPAVGRIPQDEHPRRHLLPERRARAAHPATSRPIRSTKIVVNCAGRTRSIIGAQTLIDFGVPNPVFALENGTQGWFLAGLELARNADRRYGEAPCRDGAAAVAGAAVRASVRRAFRCCRRRPMRGSATRHARPISSMSAPRRSLPPTASQVSFTRRAASSSRRPTSGSACGVPASCFTTAKQVRAPVIAGWLRQLGHEAYWLADGAAAASFDWRRAGASVEPRMPPSISVDETAAALRAGTATVLDLRSGMAYRKGHIVGAVWAIRPTIAAVRPARDDHPRRR